MFIMFEPYIKIKKSINIGSLGDGTWKLRDGTKGEFSVPYAPFEFWIMWMYYPFKIDMKLKLKKNLNTYIFLIPKAVQRRKCNFTVEKSGKLPQVIKINTIIN